MNKIDCISELKGEYNIKVLDGGRVIYSSGWRKNTILASGLTQLYTQDPSTLTQILDLGSSSAKPGAQGYSLSGIITPAEYSDFLNIQRSRRAITNEGESTRVFYSYFSTKVASDTLTLREFAVKSTITGRAFARNVLTVPVVVLPNQYIAFEYRLKIRRYHTFTTKVPFKTSSGHTFTVPITGATFNIPYNELYRNDNVLILLKNKEPLPEFGSSWPTLPEYAVRNKLFSTFRPKELGHGLDESTRTYSVSTVFSNISSKPVGLYNQINSFVLSRNTSRTYSTELTNNNFLAINVSFPLSLYNYENGIFNVDGPTNDIDLQKITLNQLINIDTDINIIADDSGSMPDVRNTLRDAVNSGALREKLLPFYKNNVSLYEQRVKFFAVGGERTFGSSMLNTGGRGGKRLINIVFQDETTNSAYNNINSTQYNNDVTQLRNTSNRYTLGNFLGFVFQVKGHEVFKTFLTSVKSGTSPFTSVNLSDRPEIKFIYDIEKNDTQQYYLDRVVDALLNIDPEVVKSINTIPSIYRSSPYIYNYYQYITNATRYNKFDLYFNYTWREV